MALPLPRPCRPVARRWTSGAPLDLALTLGPLGRGPGDPAFRIASDGRIWRASRTPVGPGTLCVSASAANAVEAHAWGPGAEWLLDRLPALLGADDEAAAAAFVPRHRVVHEARRRHPGMRLCRTGLVLESLIPAVLEQKVTSDEAYRAWRLLLWRHGEPAPGPPSDSTDGPARGMRVMPEPRRWALIPSWEWHRAGVDTKRSGTILRAVRLARQLEQAAAMAPEEAAARLRLVSGVGPWTAAETVQRTHGAPDAITVGDLHLPRVVGHALTGERGTDDAGMLRLLEPYAGQRHRAARLILLAGPRLPRRAPRFSPNDIRLI